MFDLLRPKDKSAIFRFLLALFFSLLYVFVPWTEIRPNTEEDGGDIFAYLTRIENLLDERDTPLEEGNFLKFWSQEPLWRYILILIGNFFDEPLNGLLLISFFCIFTYSFFLFGQINILVASFLLLNPLVIDLVITQVRSAFAMALCLNALNVKNYGFAFVLIVISSLIHTVTLIFLIVYIIANVLESKQYKYDYKMLRYSALFLAMVLAVLLGGGVREMILGAIGDRRAEHLGSTSSFLYLGYWVLLALALAIMRKDYASMNYWGDYYSIIMLALPFFMAIFSANGTRFIALSMVIVLPTIFTSSRFYKIAMLSSLLSYQIFQYLYWFALI